MRRNKAQIIFLTVAIVFFSLSRCRSESLEIRQLDHTAIEVLANDVVHFLNSIFLPAKTELNIIKARGADDDFVKSLITMARIKGFAIGKEGETINYMVDTLGNNTVVTVIIPNRCRFDAVYDHNFRKLGENVIRDNFEKVNRNLNDKVTGLFPKISR